MTFRGPLQPCPFCDFNDSVLLWTDEFCISEDYSFAYFLNTVLTSKNAHFKYRRIKQLKRIIFSKTLIYQNLYTDILYRILEYCKHTYKNKQSFFFFFGASLFNIPCSVSLTGFLSCCFLDVQKYFKMAKWHM